MKATYIGDNKLREVPEMANPEKESYWGGDKRQFGIDLTKYNKQLAACKEYPISGTHNFKEGEVYEEGKDYIIDHCHPMGMAFGQEQYSNILQRQFGSMVIPIQKAKDDLIEHITSGIKVLRTMCKKEGLQAGVESSDVLLEKLKHFAIPLQSKPQETQGTPSEEWISVEDRLPEIKRDVLLYYTIERKDGKIYEYWTVGFLNSITDGGSYKQTEWIGKGWNPMTPTHWMPLPNKPETKM